MAPESFKLSQPPERNTSTAWLFSHQEGSRVHVLITAYRPAEPVSPCARPSRLPGQSGSRVHDAVSVGRDRSSTPIRTV